MAKAPASKLGRPTSYTKEKGDELCARVMESDYGLEQVCEAEDMPSARTAFRWIAEFPDFCQQYTRAKAIQGEVQADRGLKDALSATDAALGRLKFDARKWAASKLAPKKYGDKVALVGGDDSDRPIQTEGTVTVRFVRPGDVPAA